jgi:TIR domain-containing protein
MPDVFISHSSSDRSFAEFLHRHLTSEGLTVFLAPLSLVPGQRWPQEILNALEASSWVLFLASRTACASPWVQQELGAALVKQKKIVPIVWDIPPSQLPGWIGHIQAVNLAGASPEQIQAQITAVAGQIKADKAKGLLIGGLLIAGLFALAARN